MQHAPSGFTIKMPFYDCSTVHMLFQINIEHEKNPQNKTEKENQKCLEEWFCNSSQRAMRCKED